MTTTTQRPTRFLSTCCGALTSDAELTHTADAIVGHCSRCHGGADFAPEDEVLEFLAGPDDHEIVDRRGEVKMIGTKDQCLRFYALGRGETVRPRQPVQRFLADFAQRFPSEVTR